MVSTQWNQVIALVCLGMLACSESSTRRPDPLDAGADATTDDAAGADQDATSLPDAADACADAGETCDERDNDCDGEVDEGLAQIAWYIDRDEDRRGDVDADPVLACTMPDGYSRYNDDCDDDDRNVRPTVTELCNHTDDDCDDQVDENVSVMLYADRDADGRGAGPAVATCPFTTGFAPSGDDCDDAAPLVHPGQLELCDALDNDCDSTIDESCVSN